MKPSIPLVKEEDLSPELKQMLDALPPANLLWVFANAPASFKPFIDFGSSILFGSEFDAKKREFAVLRVAHISKCDYVWTQHLKIAAQLGITDNEIKSVSSENPVTSLDDEGNLLCRVADEITKDVRLSDDALSQIIDNYGNRGATELILCISHFNLMVRFIESTRIELEDGGGGLKGTVEEVEAQVKALK